MTFTAQPRREAAPYRPHLNHSGDDRDAAHIDDDADVVEEGRVHFNGRMEDFLNGLDISDAPRERTSKQNKRAEVFGSVKMNAAPASSNEECKQS